MNETNERFFRWLDEVLNENDETQDGETVMKKKTLDKSFIKRLIRGGARDEEVWRSDEDGRHYKLESKTGEITGGFGGKLNGVKVGSKSKRAGSVSEGSAPDLEDIFGDLWNSNKGGTEKQKEELTNLEDIFGDLWNGKGDNGHNGNSGWEKEEREQKERESYGQNGLLEKEYPEKLRLTEAEKDELYNVLRSYRDEDYKGNISQDLMETLNGHLTKPMLEQKEREYKKQLSEAEEKIQQRKDEGYSYKKNHQGEPSIERKNAWWRYYKEHGEAPDGVGERGIQHWQIQRKKAQERLDMIGLAKKVAERNEYAKSNEHYVSWRNNPNSQNEKYAPWVKDGKTMKTRAIDRAIYRILSKIPARDSYDDIDETEDGGPGSGNWGHHGRPGLRGGSGKGGGNQYRGGRADMGNFYGSKHDWLNGLNGERQKEVTNMLKTYGDGDIRKGEKAIMQGKNDAAKVDYLKALSEARKWDEHSERLFNNLEEDEANMLDHLQNKLLGSGSGNTIAQEIETAQKSLSPKEFTAYADLLSKAMNGEVSGEDITKNLNKHQIASVLANGTYESSERYRARITSQGLLMRIVDSDDYDQTEENYANMLNELPEKAFSSAKKMEDTKKFLKTYALLGNYGYILSNGDNELAKENLDLLKNNVNDFTEKFLSDPGLTAACEDEMWSSDSLTTEQKQKYLSNKYQLLGGNEPLKLQKIKQTLSQDLVDRFDHHKVEYKKPEKLPTGTKMSQREIIDKVGGPDKTSGSCGSVCLAYLGNEMGLDVLDYRGGWSRDIISEKDTVAEICKAEGIKSWVYETHNDFEASRDLLPRMEKGKEYILSIARHRAIVRRDEAGTGYEYLELQGTSEMNGWHPLNNDTLRSRFACKRSRTRWGEKWVLKTSLVEADSLRDNEAFIELLGYLNTEQGKEKKGAGGYAK